MVDPEIKEGPVFVIKNDQPRYVILDYQRYEELIEGYEEAYVARVKAALQEARAGLVRESTAQEIIDEFGLER